MHPLQLLLLPHLHRLGYFVGLNGGALFAAHVAGLRRHFSFSVVASVAAAPLVGRESGVKLTLSMMASS